MTSLNDTHIPSFNLYLQSDEYSTKTSDASVTFDLKQKVTIPAGTRALVGLIDFEMPYSFYNVTQYNNKFNVSTSVGELNLELPLQNYDSDSIIDALNNLLSTNASTIGTTIVMTVNYNTNKFTFTSNTLDFTILDTTTLWYELGLVLPQTSSSKVLTATNTLNLSGTPYLEIDTNLSITQLTSQTDKDGVLIRLPIRVETTDYIFYQAVDNVYHMIGDRNIDTIQITLKDYKGNILDLNGAIFSMTINFQFQQQRVPQLTNPYQLSDVYKQLFQQTVEQKEETPQKIEKKG